MPMLDQFKQILLAAVQDPDFVRKNSMFCSNALLSQTIQRINEITGQLYFTEDWSTVASADGNAVVDSAEGRIRVTQSVVPTISTVTFNPRSWTLPPRLLMWLTIPEANQLDPSEYYIEYTILPAAMPPSTWVPVWTKFQPCEPVPLPTYGIQLRAVINNPLNPIEYLPKIVVLGYTA